MEALRGGGGGQRAHLEELRRVRARSVASVAAPVPLAARLVVALAAARHGRADAHVRLLPRRCAHEPIRCVAQRAAAARRQCDGRGRTAARRGTPRRSMCASPPLFFLKRAKKRILSVSSQMSHPHFCHMSRIEFTKQARISSRASEGLCRRCRRRQRWGGSSSGSLQSSPDWISCQILSADVSGSRSVGERRPSGQTRHPPPQPSSRVLRFGG